MRVVAGSARGRRLVVPDGDAIRPTSDRVREAVFNTLYSLGGVDDARVLDLYAGTGAMGIEALSRGAGHATFVERSRDAVAALRENLEIAGVAERAEVIEIDVESYLATRPPRFDLAIVDPPYAYDAWDSLLSLVPADLVVVESGREIEAPVGWETHRARRYGSTVVSIVSPHRSGPHPAGSPSK